MHERVDGKTVQSVIPAKAGIQKVQQVLDSRFRGNDVVQRLVSLFSLLLLLLLGSCAPASPDREPGVLALRLASNPTTLDPAYIVDVTGGTLAAKLFNGLVRFGDDLSIQPDVASRWEISPDGKRYIFHLRDDVLFANGRKVGAEDFKYSFQRVLSPETGSPVTWVLDRIEGGKDYLAGKRPEVRGIVVRDPRTLEIRLAAPFAPFLGLLAMTPAYVVPREEVLKDPDRFAVQPVGTGPYRVEQWKHGEELRLIPHEKYFGEKPRLRGIVYRIIPEDLTALVEFETGRIDALPLPAAEFRRYLRDPDRSSRILSQAGLNTYYLGLTCSRPPLNDPRVRQAIALAIDREKILNTIYEDRGELARGPVPPILWPADKDQSVRPEPVEGQSPFNPTKARALLKEAGYPNGFSMTLTLTADPEVIDIAEVIQHYLKEVGIRVTIRQLEWSAFKEATAKGETDAFYLSWWADYPDPENFLFPLFHSSNAGAGGNRSRFADPMTDRLIEEAQGTPDPALRTALYQKAEHRVIEQSPWVFLWHKKDFVAYQPWVEGLRLYPIYSMDKGLGVSVRDKMR